METNGSYETRVRWESMGVYGSSWNLPSTMVVEVSVDGSLLPLRVEFSHLLPSTSMEASHQLPCRLPCSRSNIERMWWIPLA